MSRVLVYTSPARGHLFPAIPIVDELLRRGHEVSVRTLASQLELVRGRGCAAEPIAAEIEAIEHDDWGAKGNLDALKRALRVFGGRAAHEVGDLRAAIEAERPDLLLLDVNCWGAAAAAEAGDLPWASWCPYPLPTPSRDAPPFGPGLAPARGLPGRLRDAVLRPLLVGGYERALRPLLDPVRESVGLAPIQPVEYFERPPLLLYLTAEPFEYPRRDWPRNVRMVGAVNWDPPAAAPEWLAEVDRPLVLVTTSSEFQDDSRLVAVALEALAEEDVFVVATLPAAQPPSGPVPANARVERFVPHAPLLERAACAITHGGMGATQKALAAGVPVCVVPFGRDQLEVARRAEVAGAGARLPAARLRPDRLREKVGEAMAARAGARRVAEGYRRAGGAAAAAEALKSLLYTRASRNSRSVVW